MQATDKAHRTWASMLRFYTNDPDALMREEGDGLTGGAVVANLNRTSKKCGA